MSPDGDLRTLARVEPSAALDRRVRRVVADELAAARGRPHLPGSIAGVAASMAIAFTVAGYLHWAVSAASALYR